MIWWITDLVDYLFGGLLICSLSITIYSFLLQVAGICVCFYGGYTLVTLPRIVTPYRDSVDGTRDRVTYQKLVTR